METKWLLVIVTALILIVFLVWELKFPAREYTVDEKKRSYLTNVLIFLFNNVVVYLFGIGLVYAFVSKYALYELFSGAPMWVQLLGGIIILDFAIWFWHVLNHKVPLFWRFHQTHHSEIYLNTTSAVRFHTGELLLSVVYKSVIIIALGIPLEAFFIYEALITIFAIYHHANVALPHNMESITAKVFITPRLHRIHHSDKRAQHDSNYGVIFSWWDQICKTKERSTLQTIGLMYGGERDFISFLTMPFQNFRK